GSSCSRVTSLILVLSILTTRLSWRNLPASWPYPTSIAYTFDAPCCSRQSVKPPADAPASKETFPVTSILKSANAPSNFKPPLKTYLISLPFSYVTASSLSNSPAVLPRCRFTKTFPDILELVTVSQIAKNPRTPTACHR